MPISYAESLDEACTQAQDKVATLKSPARYAALAALAGAYIGVAVVLLASVAGPLAAASNPATKLVQGAVFGIALTLVVFAGAELFTGNNMVMLIGWLRGGVSGAAALLVNVASLLGNLVGSIAFAAMVHASGVLSTHTPGKPAAGDGMIGTIVAGKIGAGDGQLFWRAVLCNMLVCLGLWMATRTRSDGAKLAVLFWALLAFIASGFEHCVANMTIFALAVFNDQASWGDLAHNLLITVPATSSAGHWWSRCPTHSQHVARALLRGRRRSRGRSPKRPSAHLSDPSRPSRKGSHMRRLVVVGNGMVGQRFVEALRERDADDGWQVTVVGEERRQAYDRVALSSYFDGASAESLDVVVAGCYDHPAHTLHLDETVTTLDRRGHTVTTGTGRVLGYDALVLATGSYPFVPPVPGRELPGCFVYRTLDDLDAIRDAAERATLRRGGRPAAMVVGGGLLGLEAARALRLLGMSPHVVELAPRLMPLQIDEGGGGLLKQLIEELDVTVHVATSVTEIVPDRGRMLATLTNGHELDLDLVVFSAGVRPRDELAVAAGLEVGPRGGVAVDAGCRTSDDDVFAVGECASVDGIAYGLVAPGFAMAEVVADRLVGGTAEFPDADTATKLKLLGVDVASFGDAHAATPGALAITVNNPVERSYSKLVVSDDASTLLGGILVGDASRYAMLRPMVGGAIAGDPLALISPDGAGVDAGAMPDSAQVCSCHAVAKGAICSAIGAHGLTDVPGIKSATKAGTGCGSCLPLLKTLLAESGVEVSSALCEHFSQTRAELFEIVAATGITTFGELVERFGTGRGCDLCKPAVASILASQTKVGHVLDGESATLQDTNDHFLANMQKDGTYSVVPRIPGGEITPDKLIVIGEIARDFDLYTKITGGQRVDLFGARVEQLPLIWKRLVDAGFESGHAYGKALRTVKSCVGSTWCRFGVQDSVGLAVDLELRYRGLRAPHKLKSAVSGCARECAEAQSKDFGVIATENGWNLYVGGNGGFKPRHADLLVADVDARRLVEIIDRFLMFYVRTADRLQRTAPWIEALDGGLQHLREVIVDDSLGICADLDAAMAKHIENYSDEWADVLEDPQRLKRFVSFVNAPLESVPGEWAAVCIYDDLQPERGVAALVGDTQVALFRTFDGMLYAMDNRDPFSGQSVLSRGIVGSRGATPTVASPLYKQAFDLATGVCVTDPSVSVAIHDVRRNGDDVEVRLRTRAQRAGREHA